MFVIALKRMFLCFDQEENVRPLFFQERTINGIVYIDMLQQFFIPYHRSIMMTGKEMFYLCKLAHHHTYLTDVRDFLNGRFPGQWNGRDAPIAGFPRPDTASLFLWGFIKDMVYVPLLPYTLPELRARIYAAAEQVTPEHEKKC
jgi:hypothetical protein